MGITKPESCSEWLPLLIIGRGKRNVESRLYRWTSINYVGRINGIFARLVEIACVNSNLPEQLQYGEQCPQIYQFLINWPDSARKMQITLHRIIFHKCLRKPAKFSFHRRSTSLQPHYRLRIRKKPNAYFSCDDPVHYSLSSTVHLLH